MWHCGKAGGEMSAVASDAACVEFSQHAWRPELCVNCQRPRNEHTSVAKPTSASARIIISQSKPLESLITSKEAESSPVPNKRVSTLPRQSKTAAARTPQGTPTPTEKPSDNGTAEEITRQKKDGMKNTGWKKSKIGQSEQGIELRSVNLSEQSSEVHKNKLDQGSDSNQNQPVEDGKSYCEEKKKNEPPKGILSRKRSDSRKKTEEKPSSRVAFIDASPHIIGYDGGVGSVFDDDDDDISPESEDTSLSSSEGSFSLTDEEKSFALLSLENTVWNSDAENLLQDRSHSSSSHHHSSREFEDVSLDALCFSKRFQNLRDCDATKHFGTFPLRKRSSGTKQGLDSVFSESGRVSAADLDASRLSSFDLDPVKDGEPSGSETHKQTHSSQGSSSTSGHVKARPAMAESSTPAYKVVNIVDGSSSRDSNATADVAACLHDASQSRRHDSDSVSENSGNSSGRGHASSSESNSPTRVKVRGRSRPTAIRVSTFERQDSPQRDSSAEKGEAEYDPLNDSTTAAGLQVLALLNDVLDNYGDNESSTDDPSDLRAEEANDQENQGPGKKSADFEARMASVAANLDLSKQQRAKRPAPRPPRSPPPEPTVSPKKKTQNQPEPVFKMVPMGKAIMAVPPTHDVPKSLASGPHGQGLPSFEDLPEGEADRSNGEAGRAKKGITSFFKNILRRGRDSTESAESSNPEVQFVVRSEVGSSSAPTLTDACSDALSKKGSDPVSGQSKFRVLPPGAATAVKGGSASTGDLPGFGVKRPGDGEGSGSTVTQDKPSSPPSQVKSKGLSSPKQMLRRTAAKLSPPTQHKALSHAKDDSTATTPKTKSSLTPKKSDDRESSEASSQPTPVRRRAKSPKRIPPPAPPPTRPLGGGKSEDGWSADLTRELEQRLRPSGASASTPNIAPPVATKPAPQSVAAKSVSQTLKPDSPSPTSRAEIRKSMTVPPPSPPTSKVSHVSRSPPTSPTPEELDSQPGSPTDDLSNSDDSPRFMEKIELPTAAPGKKGILGKLNMNRKSRAPAPPSSVKRARSISDAEKRMKRINPADISGPVVGCLLLLVNAVLVVPLDCLHLRQLCVIYVVYPCGICGIGNVSAGCQVCMTVLGLW